MASNKQYVYRPKAMSLESFAISRGIVESVSSNHPLVEKLRLSLSVRGTDGSGFSDLQRRFTAMDKDGSRTLFLEEFKIAFQRCNVNFSDQEITAMFYLFDEYDKKYIDYEEFMIAIRGPINYRRRQFIEKAFQMIDNEGRGMVDPEEIIDRYDPTNHPDAKNGLKKSQEVFRDFLRVFDVSTEVDGKITRNEFENYYFNLSASIERDDYFEQVICNAWRMDRNLSYYDNDRNNSNNGVNGNTTMSNNNGYRGRTNMDNNSYASREYNNNIDRRPRTFEELSYDRESNRSANNKNFNNNSNGSNNYDYTTTNGSDSPSRGSNNRANSRKSSPNRQRGRSASPVSRNGGGNSSNGPRSPTLVYENDQREF